MATHRNAPLGFALKFKIATWLQAAFKQEQIDAQKATLADITAKTNREFRTSCSEHTIRGILKEAGLQPFARSNGEHSPFAILKDLKARVEAIEARLTAAGV